MYGTTTDDASLAVRLNIKKNIQQTWGTARMAGRITEGDYQRQTEEHESNMAQLLAKPTPTIYTLPKPAPPAKPVLFKRYTELMAVSFNCLSMRSSGRLTELLAVSYTHLTLPTICSV